MGSIGRELDKAHHASSMNQISGCQYIVAFIHTDSGSAASAFANCCFMVFIQEIRLLSNLPDQTMAFIGCQAEICVNSSDINAFSMEYSVL